MHARTSTCPLRQRGPPSSLHSHPRVPVAALVLQAALAEPSSQLVITTLPPRSPSCAPRLCSFYHLQQLAGAGGASGYPHNWRPKDPKIPRTHKAEKQKKKKIQWTQQHGHTCAAGYSRDGPGDVAAGRGERQCSALCIWSQRAGRERMAEYCWEEVRRCERFKSQTLGLAS